MLFVLLETQWPWLGFELLKAIELFAPIAVMPSFIKIRNILKETKSNKKKTI